MAAGLDISSPELSPAMGRPRIFAHADVGVTIDSEDPVVSEGDPGDPPVFDPVFHRFVAEIDHKGSSIRAEANPLLLSGGIGVAFAFEALDRTFYVKPSVEWAYQRDTVRVRVGAARRQTGSGTACPCTTLFLQAQADRGYHSLGPGLEVEVEAARAGDFLIGVFVSGRAYAILGSRESQVSATASWNPPTRPDSTFTAIYEREQWHYRFGGGLRISWAPE